MSIMVKDVLDNIYESFVTFFGRKGYLRVPEVKISSGIDESVTLIGSGISVLKPFLLEKRIPQNGLMITQRAIRTHALKNIYNTEYISEYNSFFDAFCVLSHYDNLDNLFEETEEFFHSCLNVSPTEILFRVSGSDTDLLNACYLSNCLVEKDTNIQSYYRHKYGLDNKGIYGRNVNFALKNPFTKEFRDVGNIIVIESENEKYGVELALGVQSIALRLLGANNTLEVSYVADYMDLSTPAALKYADSLIVVSLLEYEHIKDCTKRYPKYLYKRYYRALKYWQEQLGIDDQTLERQKDKFICLEYNKTNGKKR